MAQEIEVLTQLDQALTRVLHLKDNLDQLYRVQQRVKRERTAKERYKLRQLDDLLMECSTHPSLAD